MNTKYNFGYENRNNRERKYRDAVISIFFSYVQKNIMYQKNLLSKIISINFFITFNIFKNN